jgi:hypothetical protein
MKKPTAADLAAKYAPKRKYPCIMCGLEPDQAALARACRNEQGMSYRAIARALKGEFGVQASEKAIYNHFSSHEAQA